MLWQTTFYSIEKITAMINDVIEKITLSVIMTILFGIPIATLYAGYQHAAQAGEPFFKWGAAALIVIVAGIWAFIIYDIWRTPKSTLQ